MPSPWVTNLPAGTTQVRMLPNICQDRWQNIQQGEVPSTKWQLAQRAGNPGTIASSGLIFTKAGSTGDTELFYKDDASNVTQLTSVGAIGKTSQTVKGSTYITLQSDLVTEFTNTQNGFCSAAGKINGVDGSISAAYGIASGVRNSIGNYTVFFTTNLTSADFSVQVTPCDPSNTADAWVVNVITLAQNRFSVKFRKYINAATGFSSEDTDFTFAVFMGRT